MEKGPAPPAPAPASRSKQRPTGTLPPVYSEFVMKCIQYVGREEIQTKLKSGVVDPLINHVLRRVFPYIVLTCVLFILLLVVVLLTLGIIIMQSRSAAGAGPAALRAPGV